jgi:hypothetical protein
MPLIATQESNAYHLPIFLSRRNVNEVLLQAFPPFVFIAVVTTNLSKIDHFCGCEFIVNSDPHHFIIPQNKNVLFRKVAGQLNEKV